MFEFYKLHYLTCFWHLEGHYLSASAQMWASTHNATIKEKMSTVVFSLSECQNKIGTGYLSAFPTELFDSFEALKPVWAPYYTIHKVNINLFVLQEASKWIHLVNNLF